MEAVAQTLGEAAESVLRVGSEKLHFALSVMDAHAGRRLCQPLQETFLRPQLGKSETHVFSFRVW
jgi:hypothetical protein